MALDDKASMALFEAFKNVKSNDISTVLQALSSASFRQRKVSITVALPFEEDCPLIGCSDGFIQLSGYPREAIVGRNCRFLNKKCSIRPEVRNEMRIAVKTHRTFCAVLRNRRMDDTCFPNLVHMSPLQIGDQHYMLAIQIDVTGMKVDKKDRKVVSELKDVVDAILAANIDAWVILQEAFYKGSRATFQRTLVQPNARALQATCYSNVPDNNPTHDKPTHENLASLPEQIKRNSSDGSRSPLRLMRRCRSDPTLRRSSQKILSPRERDLIKLSLDSLGVNCSSRDGDGDNSSQYPRSDETSTDPAEANNCSGDKESLGPSPVATPSDGSAGHPDTCTPCSFHWFSLPGCKKGASCKFCHLEHPKKPKKHKKKKSAAAKDPKESTSAASPDTGLSTESITVVDTIAGSESATCEQ